MKLSIHFFHTKLSHKYPGTTLLLTASEDVAFSSLGVVTKDLTVSQEILYIDLLQNSDYEQAKHVSLITSESRAALFNDCNLIVMPNEVDLSSVIDFVSNTFTYYFDWADTIHEAIARNLDLQAIIDLSIPVIGNPMYIADSSFKMLVKWGGDFGEANPTWNYQERFHYLPYQVMQDLIESGELEKIHKRPDAWIVRNSKGFTALPFISKSIQKEGVHYGNFFIIGYYKPLDRCDIELANYLGTVLSTAIYGNLSYLAKNSLYNAHFLADIIEGTLTDRQLVVDQLKVFDWSIQDDYMLALFDTVGDSDAIQQHMMALIINSLNAQCLSYHGELLAILNHVSEKKDDVLKQLAQIARDFNRALVVSEQFNSFDLLDRYYEQVRFMLDTDEIHLKKGQFVSYEDVFVDHLIKHVDHFVPPYAPAERLKTHDNKNNTEYCKTLYTWLTNERNSVKTAEILYIHRNTLKNRLGHIEKIIRVDLESYARRQRMILSLVENC